MAPRPSKSHTAQIDDIDAQIAKLQEKKKGVLQKRSERVAKIVLDSGLADLDVDDGALLDALKAVAARFQKPAASQPGTSSSQA